MRFEITLDCTDLERVASFWATAAELDIDGIIEGRYITLTGRHLTLTLQRVDEPKSGKNRMHLDLLVDDIDETARRFEALGATRLTENARHEFGQTWYVMADPEGNEFCIAGTVRR